MSEPHDRHGGDGVTWIDISSFSEPRWSWMEPVIIKRVILDKGGTDKQIAAEHRLGDGQQNTR